MDNGINTNRMVFFAIVIYNKECKESPSVMYAINHLRTLKPIIVDNSTIKTENAYFCENHNITYLSMEGNAGLSKAYNRVLSFLNGKDGYIVWADDDTEFPDNYVNDMLEASIVNNYTIALPLVLTGNDIYSPISIDFYGIPKRINNIDELGRRITGINSGMMVNLEFYKTYKYDEKMFLDFIDHDLCISCENHGEMIGFVKNVVLIQKSFFLSKIDIKSMIKRRKIYRHDFRIFCQKHCIDHIIVNKKILHGEVAIGIKFIKQLLFS